MENLTVISHIYNEEFLLPFWLEHNSKIFKNGIIIDYMSTDKSLDIIKTMCPHWKIITTRNMINNKPNFEASCIDDEVSDIEKTITGFKICLNTTEFLFIDNNFVFPTPTINLCYMIPAYSAASNDTYFLPKNYNEFLQKMNLISTTNNRHNRFMHNFKYIKYQTGRHQCFARTTDIYPNMVILHVANYNKNKFFIDRRMQIQNNIPESDKKHGFGVQHILNSENDVLVQIDNILKQTTDISNNKVIENLVHSYISV
jgi:hypothetical protein